MALNEEPGRVLGIDHGTRRCGLALSDPTGVFASPLEVVEGSEAELVARIAVVARVRSVIEIVIGLPLNMDGTVGPQARAAEAFGAKLSEKLRLPVRTWEERLSTREAANALAGDSGRERGRGRPGLSERDRKERLDKVAASLILQGYLDYRARRRKNSPPAGPLPYP